MQVAPDIHSPFSKIIQLYYDRFIMTVAYEHESDIEDILYFWKSQFLYVWQADPCPQ